MKVIGFYVLYRLKLAKAIYKTFLTSSSSRFISLIENATKQYILCQIKAAANVSLLYYKLFIFSEIKNFILGKKSC